MEMTTNLVIHQDALTRLVAAAQQATENSMRRAKFAKGIWTLGDVEDNGGRYIVHPDQFAHGFTKFKLGKFVEQRMGLATDPMFVLPERPELGDMDQSQWEIGPNGKPTDPWVSQQSIPLEDVDSGEWFLFSTSSTGGKAAIAKIVHQFTRNLERGRPIAELGKDFYKHSKFGRVDTPLFKVVGWTGEARNLAPRTINAPRTVDMNDHIPF
jgi:hypothetical protein